MSNKTRIRIAILVTIFVFFVGGVVYINTRHMFKDNDVYKCVPPYGYAEYIVEDVTSRDDYIKSDIDGRMPLFYDYLIDISENGYIVEAPSGEEYYKLILYPGDIVIDRDNMIISFREFYDGVETDGWDFAYYFQGEYLVDCDRMAALN